MLIQMVVAELEARKQVPAYNGQSRGILYEQLSKYGDTKSARAIMLVELKKLIEENPLFRKKLQFLNLKNSRLRTLINQSLNWQHQLCKTSRLNPDIRTLFVDHSCGSKMEHVLPHQLIIPCLAGLCRNPVAFLFSPYQPAPAPVLTLFAGWMSNPPTGVIRRFLVGPLFLVLHQFQPYQPAPAPVLTLFAGWMSNPPTGSHPAVSGGPIVLGAPPIPASSCLNDLTICCILQLPLSTQGHHQQIPLNFHLLTHEHPSKNTRQLRISDHVNLPVNVLPLYVDNSVGTNLRDFGLWEVGSRERLVLRNSKEFSDLIKVHWLNVLQQHYPRSSLVAKRSFFATMVVDAVIAISHWK
ncbi:transducin family protein / WD-40 repeat family protein [Striga asiatica]|uniref:Transducin family protein / WD-40 repeat family protein n=1 Tax=Striga asiatica TaxID=4170 RepID=A0A5A7Q399_STRAF|nr:transducin family protein / WD-40 repeat family protein [Striga asiatica]